MSSNSTQNQLVPSLLIKIRRVKKVSLLKALAELFASVIKSKSNLQR